MVRRTRLLFRQSRSTFVLTFVFFCHGALNGMLNHYNRQCWISKRDIDYDRELHTKSRSINFREFPFSRLLFF